jgi:LuxR family maltose regulon positive regulatory protein
LLGLVALHQQTQGGAFVQQQAHEAFLAGGLQHLAQREPLMGEYLQRLLQAFGPLPVEVEKTAAMPCSLQEPLTRKEIRVLELLVEGYSNSAMAEKLYVSDSTVRTHLRNINAKLGAHNRTQAVAIARRLGVL